MGIRWLELVWVMALSAGAALVLSAGAPWLAGVWVATAYVLGRVLEQRWWLRRELAEQRDTLETFCHWAEAVLASAPEELPPDQEQLRSRLQGEYQAAQAALGKLRR